ncbi:ABC transporter ATP-binding protein [Muricoprocola aceti]|uniref:ABC transporter ATP-binding protein/permease n=1 Tax=Muricoprocola aceti TaxID=2981772 RepID=A0ABT2SJD1_9FIRM|nr:ABC transporter ATP-binding protein [Muricoprocola aceti]MCU6724604.1 ABC transporter ATP-binding protein/permease [Muricoprocola aceti]
MRALLKYLRNYKKETVLAPLFKLLEASFELFVPLVMAAIIDHGIGQADGVYVLKMGGVLIALGLIGLVCSITAQYFAAKAATGFSTELRHELFEHIQKLSYTKMDTIGTSTLITRMTSDINQVQSGVNLVLRLFLRSPFIVFGAMVMAFTVDVKAALVFVAAIPLLSLVVFGIMLITMPLYRKVQSNLDAVLGITRENLTGVRVIRAFNKEANEKQRFEQQNQMLTDAQKFVGKISGLMNPVTYIIVNGALIVLIYTGALRVDAGIITQGQVVALVNYMSQILVELVKLANLIITVTKAFACGNRIQSVFEEETGMTEGSEGWTDPGEADTPVVEFDHVNLRYAGAGEDSLTDISFRAMPGQTIGVIGGTGSGKSSVVNLIPRFYDATEGSVRIQGKDARDYRLEELRSHIGMVPQKAVLFQGTIAQNLRWGKENATEAELEKAIEISQAKEFVDGKEDRLNYQIEQNGKNLSGGQRQRLTIARALVRDPEILILDDSASALDFATDAKLRKAIRQMDSHPVVFIVSQRASSIQYADQILVLDDGELAGIGTHAELMESCEIYREIYESQFEKEKKGVTDHGTDK